MTGWRVAVWVAVTLTVGLLREPRTWAVVGAGVLIGFASRCFISFVSVALGGLP